MSVVMEMTKAYLDSQGMHYRERSDAPVLQIGIGGLKNAGQMEVIVVFDDNDRTVSLRSFNLCQVPEEKKAAMYAACNAVNRQYRWVKFYIDEKDSTVTAQDDAVLQADSAGQEIFELIIRMSNIVDEAYPTLMKANWA